MKKSTVIQLLIFLAAIIALPLLGEILHSVEYRYQMQSGTLWGACTGIIAAALGCIGIYFLIRFIRHRKTDTQDHMHDPWNTVLSIAAGCAFLVMPLFGIGIRGTHLHGMKILLLVASIIPIAQLLLNQLLLRIKAHQIDKKSVAQMQDFLIAHRDEDKSELLLKKVVRSRHLTAVHTAVLIIATYTIGFCIGALELNGYLMVLLIFEALFALACVCVRIQLRIPKTAAPSSFVLPSDYPTLYALAEKARDTLHCKGEIKICFSADCNAGIASVDGIYYLEIGAVLLAISTEEELYAVLLHEFAHTASETKVLQKETRYLSRLDATDERISQILLYLLYRYFDDQYWINYQLYSLSVSLRNEYNADQAMIKYASPDAVGSVLLKFSYYDYFRWEDIAGPNWYSEDTPDKEIFRKEVERFQRTIAQRKNDWNQLAKNEIQSRSASHPTLHSRLEALGIHDPALLEASCSPELFAERQRALDDVGAQIYDSMAENYAIDRQDAYENPLKTIHAWEAAGKPLLPEAYSDVLHALWCLQRCDELEKLCDRAIAELPIMSSHDAYFMKGILLLHRYDPAGIEYLYSAIEANQNHLESGLQEIGQFCCLTGRKEELEVYRQRALDLEQKDKDLYSQIGVLNKSDKLSAEHLPDDLMNGLLAFIPTVGENALSQVYLVHKQIAQDYSTSVVVLRFKDDVSDQVAAEITHKFFLYLDNTTDWQFSLFDYLDVKHVHVENIPGSCIYENKTNF